MNILFICSRNQWRSPTAEAIYQNVDGLNVRSAGTSDAARVQVSANHINWADMIFVMEHKHKKRLLQDYREALNNKEIIVLDIPDEYGYMDEELIGMIRASVDPYVEKS